jgi:hypothetical protein
MHVTWNLAYSGSTPEKLLLADELARANQGTLNATATEAEKVQAQQLAEFMRQYFSSFPFISAYKLPEPAIDRTNTWQ